MRELIAGLVVAVAAVLPQSSPESLCQPINSRSPAVPFHLHRPDVEGIGIGLDSWCSAVGPAILDANTDRDSDTGDIAVVSWNVHGDAGRLGDLIHAIRSGTLLGAPAEQMVLLLQEVVRSDGEIPAAPPPGSRFARPLARGPASHTDVRQLARTLGLNYVYVPSMRNGRGQEDRGNAVLSTLPVAAVDAFELPLGRQRRVVVAATLRDSSPSRPLLRVVSAHFDTAVLPAAGGPARWRGRQARALVEWLSADASPTVIGGDLNTWWGADEPAVRELRRAYPEAVDRAPLAKTWRGPLGTDNRLDYLFAGGWGTPLEVNRIDARFGSDHTPIYLNLR